MNRWMMNKAGLINFWYYDEEKFNFEDGKLLLRGNNGSGKSVTMQSLIPLLLDGNKSPERLDPFGSRARKLENYLLGEEENSKEESTGYIYMEFKKENSNNYLTIGMGLNAKKGRNLDFWGFVITDGRRIGEDFFLYKNLGDKVALSKTELKNRIAEGGEIKEGQKEYMAMVNKYLFGFDEIEEYDELIKLLIQLRTPKLSKDFKPTVIYEIMNNSLQPLSDEDLRPMSEAIENMDNIKNRLEELKVSKKAADRLKNAYDQYNRFILFEKTKDYLSSQDILKKLNREEKELEKRIKEYLDTYTEEDKNIEELEIRRKTLEENKRELEKHDSYNIRETLIGLNHSLKESENEKSSKEEALNKKKDREREVYVHIKDIEGKEDKKTKEIEELLEEMDTIADDFRFHEQGFLSDEILRNIKIPYDFTYVKGHLNNYGEKIGKIKKSLEEENVANREYDNRLKDLETIKDEKITNERKLEAANLLLSETKEEFIEKTHLWNLENKEFKLSKDGLMDLVRRVNLYGDKHGFDDIVAELRKEYNQIEGILNGDKHSLIAEKESAEKSYENKKIELEEWINQKEPEPIREEKVTKNREKLRAENIPHIPFYRAVDFHKDLTEIERGQLEEALLDMGILDALIIPEKYKSEVLNLDKEMADKYIFASPKFLAYELSQKLKAEKVNIKGLTEEDIDNVLKTILLDEEPNGTFINESGIYGIGVIVGKISSSYTSKYIGTSSRKRFKEEIIEKLNRELESIKAEIDLIDNKIHIMNKKLSLLKEEYNSFPDKKDLEVANNEVFISRLDYNQILKELDKAEEEVSISYKKLQDIRQIIHGYVLNMEIPNNLEAYEKAEEDFRDYKESLNELEMEHLKLLQLVENKDFKIREKEELDEDIDVFLYDLGKIERKIKEDTEKKSSLEEQLKISGFDEIEKEINLCIENLRVIPDLIKESTSKSATAKARHEEMTRKIGELRGDREYRAKVDNIYLNGFKEEYSLGNIFEEELKEDINICAKKVYDELKYIEKQDKNKDEYMKGLQERFHENRQYLVEYYLKMDYIFVKDVDDEEVREEILKQKRLEILGKVRGKYVNFTSLLSYMEEGIEENERLLRESDRQLFEDILAKSISKKIRAKIYSSEAWVDKMNKLMEGMNTSSGLSFSLVWRKKSAETEEQLDTKELVDILRKDGNLLREEELDKLSAHFRSKIAEARREAEERDRSQTFHSIMKEVLDYRKWFEFILYYRKSNENKRELTNNAFYKLSGGEKAMAMYVPLFSAVYAKYEGTRGDCPRIISLDEAFAGVDENNIRDMFKLLYELDLNYIINSQILWGDYDTVPALSICELIRPNNANFVTVLRYRWNGKIKELVND